MESYVACDFLCHAQDTVIKERLDRIRSHKDGSEKQMFQSPVSSAILEWKEAINKPQQGS